MWSLDACRFTYKFNWKWEEKTTFVWSDRGCWGSFYGSLWLVFPMADWQLKQKWVSELFPFGGFLFFNIFFAAAFSKSPKSHEWAKGQMISDSIFSWLQCSPKKWNFLKNFCPSLENGSNKKNKNRHYYTSYRVSSKIRCLYLFFDFTHFRG